MTDKTLASPYRGRFAPTPSGPLHLGSLLTALLSWLEARRQGGRWLLRIDDLDRPRCIPGAADEILRQLEAHGLLWDESPRYQSAHEDAYRAALAQLQAQGRLYGCRCTRARLTENSRSGPDGPVYDGRCRDSGTAFANRLALRFRVPQGHFGFADDWQGWQHRDLEHEVGDFVLVRSDGVIGYQLACAVDERDQGITDVVRGGDLLGSTFRQLLLLQALESAPPRYCHGPLLVNADGRKLSKQNHAAPITAERASENLLRCARLIGLTPPVFLQDAPPAEILTWCRAHWHPDSLRLRGGAVEPT